MSKIITPISFTRVPKLEFRQLVNSTIEIVGKNDPAALYIDGVYNLLLEAQPQLSKLVVVYRKHELTPAIQSLRNKRSDMITSILKMISSLTKANLSTMQEDLLLVQPFVDRYLKNILRERTRKVNESVEQMFATLQSDVVLNAAVTNVGLNVYFDELKSIDEQLQNLIKNRITTSSKRPRMFTRKIKTSVSEAMADLVNAIELAFKQHPEVDYMPLVNELNKLFTEFLVNMKSANTRFKNAVKAENEAQNTPAA